MTIDTGNASNTINAYRKRQQRGPFIIWGIAGLLIIVGIIILIVWLTGDNKPEIALFSTETPTPTLTSTPTITPSPTATSTVTSTATMTLTPTPSAPYFITVQDGDSLALIAEREKLGDDGILLLLALNDAVKNAGGVVYVGQEILVPNPGMKLPTATPVPFDLPRGTLLEYIIQPGDSIAAIATKFNSTEEAIIAENELENVNAILVGQVLIVPANMVTPQPTRLPPTASADANATATLVPANATPVSTILPIINETCDYTTNTEFVDQIFILVNNARSDAGLTGLTINQQLTAAAMAHSEDMGCNNYMAHTGTDDSTVYDRIATQGYAYSIVYENLYARPPEFNGDGQTAFDWWMSDQLHRDAILNTTVIEIGIGYIAVEGSALGGYFTTIFASP